MEFALKYKEKQSWNGKFPSHYKLAESIRKRKFPSEYNPSKNKPLKKGALKNISPGAYLEFYGILQQNNREVKHHVYIKWQARI